MNKFTNNSITKNAITKGAMVCLALSAGATTANAAVTRQAGGNRYETSDKILNLWPADSTSAILAAGSNHDVDALTVAPLAKQKNAPIILVDLANSIDSIVAKFAAYETVYIANGSGVVSEAIKTALEGEGINVIRLGGATRYATAYNIAKELGAADSIVVANGDDSHLADSLSIASIAAAKGMPIFLTNGTSLDAASKAYINELDASKSYVIGGSGLVKDELMDSLPNAERLFGANRYATNMAVINKFKNDPAIKTDKIYFAGGENQNLIDALTAAPLAGLTGSPIVFANPNGLGSDTATYLNSVVNNKTDMQMIGGTGAVSNSVSNSVEQIQSAKTSLISSISAISDIKDIVNGTTVDKLGLPTTIDVKLSDLTTDKANVTWDTSKYVTTKEGEQTITGTLSVPISRTWSLLDSQKIVSIKVTVKEAVLAVTTGSAINASQIRVNFNKPVDAKAAVAISNYSLSDNTNGSTQIDSIVLGYDKMSAILTVGNGVTPAALSTTKVYTLKVLNDVSKATAPSYVTALTSNAITMSDVILPSVTNVQSVGNKKIIVTFNKPILLNATPANTFAIANSQNVYTMGKDYLGGALTVSYVAGTGYTQVEVNTTNVTPIGNYSLKVYGTNSNARDVQGLNLIDTNQAFNVAQVSTVAQGTAITVKNRTTVEVTFDSAINEPAATTLVWGSGMAANSVRLVGLNKLEYTFSTNILPVGVQSFTLTGVNDSYGNIIPTRVFNATVVQDSVASAAVSSTATNSITVTFSKDMLHDASTYAANNKANYVVKDSNGAVVAITNAGYNNANSIYTVTLNGTFASGVYTVTVAGINDLVGQVVTSVTSAAVTVPDTIQPVYSNISVTGVSGTKQMVVNYGEAMAVTGDYSIANTANYKYSIDGTTFGDLPSGTILVASADGKSVTITLPSSSALTTATSKIQIGKLTSSKVYVVADAAGNILDTLAGTTGSNVQKVIAAEVAPTVAGNAASITGANTIRVALSGTQLSNISISDLQYTINNGTNWTTPVNAVLTIINGVQYIDLTTASGDVMDATTVLTKVKVRTIAVTTASKTSLGTLIAGTNATSNVVNGTAFAASISAVEVKDATHIELYLKGNVNSINVADLKVYQNGSLVNATLTATKISSSVFEITLSSSIDSDSVIAIKTVSQDLMATTDINNKLLVANTTGVTGGIKLMANKVVVSTATTAALANADTIAITFNRALNTTSVVSGWDGTAPTNVNVTVDSTGTLTIEGVGTISGYTAPMGTETFNSSLLSYNVGTKTLTITLANAVGVGALGVITTKVPEAKTALIFTNNSATKSTSGTASSTSLITLGQ